MMSDFSAWVSTRQSRFEEVLKRLLPQADATPQRLHAAMRYSVLEEGALKDFTASGDANKD